MLLRVAFGNWRARIDNIDVDVKVKHEMRIGALADASGVSTRTLRYYEEQGLLAPERAANGYRGYAPDAVEQVATIRTLLAAGLTTQAIAEVLPCTTAGPSFQPCPALTARLDGELATLDERLAALTASRALLAELTSRARS